jgi:hypothetical protein
MELKTFDKNELVKNLQVTQTETNLKVKLYNEYVQILLYITDNVTLYGFYKMAGRKEIGITRCALYYLLDLLLRDGLIQPEQNVHVSSPTPDDGDLNRLIKMYKDMGFVLLAAQPGIPTNLNASVEKLMSTLTLQCKSGGTKRKSRRFKRH